MKKYLIPTALLVITLAFAACTPSGEDLPFTFGDGTGSPVDPSRNPTGSGGVGGSGGVRAGTGGAPTAGTGGSRTGTGGAGVGTGGSGTTGSGGSPVAAGTCEVDFNTKLILKIDDAPGDPDSAGHYDSPPLCCQYAGAASSSTCAASRSVATGPLGAPSVNTDLYCCAMPGSTNTEISGFTTDYVDSIFCASSAQNRHGGGQELAVARWKPVANQKARLRFRINPDNSCEVVLMRDSFPKFNIENSALTKSISLDMGRNYGSIPGHIRDQLNLPEVVGRCTVTGSGSSYQINIDRMNVYFLAQTFNNRIKCLMTATTDAARARCSAAFADPYPADDDAIGSYQVLPGFANPALELKTDTSTQPALNPALQTAMSVTGVPLHFDATSNKSLLTLVTTIAMRGTLADRDDNAGTGILMNQLDNAILSAELEGEVTRAGTSDPIRTIDDLRNCGAAPTGTGGSSTPGTGGSGTGTGGASVGGSGGSAPVGTGGSGEGSLTVSGVRIDQVNPASSSVVPPSITNTITFSELPARGAPETRLYRLSNVGSTAVTVNNLTVTDRSSNFRLFGPMQGPTFASFVFPDNPNSMTLPVSGGMGTNDIYFYLNYGPQGTFTESPRHDSALLTYQIGTTPVTITLNGTATNESRGQLSLYIRDENRFAVTSAADKIIAGGHYYLPKNLIYSYRQDGSTDREAYLYNDAPVGSDSIVIQGISLGSHMKFNFDRTGGDLPEACFIPPVMMMGMSVPNVSALGSAMGPCGMAMNATLNAGQGVKLGKIIFRPDMSATTYNKFWIDMAVKAPSGAMANRPRIGGGDAGTHASTDTIVNYTLKGAEGAPSGPKGLRINRLLAGFQNKIHDTFQKSLTVSSMTPGILSRYAGIGGSRTTTTDWRDVFTLESSPTRGAIFLDPVRGRLTLTRIATPLERTSSGVADLSNPIPSATLHGVRLFNSPGSNGQDVPRFPGGIEYYPQCKDAPAGRCSFFYIYMGDFASSTVPLTAMSGAPALCQGKKAASSGYNRSVDATVLNPIERDQYDCIKNYNLKDVTGGYYDPVTGDIVLSDMVLRLFAPGNPRLPGVVFVDTSVRISFTTGCVTPDMVPDSEARANGVTVPDATRLDRSSVDPSRTAFNDTLIPRRPTWPERSPLSNYIGNASGANCASGTLHGRTLFNTTDPTDTNDNDLDRIDIGHTFDIAGVGRLTSTNTEIGESNMYIIIKAEILDAVTSP